jgi:multidrug resistance efflux pump
MSPLRLSFTGVSLMLLGALAYVGALLWGMQYAYRAEEEPAWFSFLFPVALVIGGLGIVLVIVSGICAFTRKISLKPIPAVSYQALHLTALTGEVRRFGHSQLCVQKRNLMTIQSNNTHALLGFPRPAGAPGPSPIVTPKPLPKRPKGRWFLGLILLTVCAVVGYLIWNTFFRYQAYGVVTGRVIKVSPPWEGVVKYLHVREGDKVTQGQLLFTVDNLDLRQRYDRLNDDLLAAQASLKREAAKMKWQAALSSNQSQEAVSQYYETQAKLLKEQATLEALQVEYERGVGLRRVNAIAEKELSLLRLSCQGQERFVKQLKISLAELKKRANQTKNLINKGGDLTAGLAEAGYDQLRPDLARIEAVQAEKARLKEQLDSGQVRAPANGIVVRSYRFAGEYCKPDEPMLTLLEEGSVQVVLYMPQNASNLLAVGDTVDLNVIPFWQPARCKVVRLGNQYEAAPTNLARYYWADEKLLPIYLRPDNEAASWRVLRLGEVVQLPYRKPAVLMEGKNDPNE